MAWTELKGTRKVIDNDPHHIDYVIGFTAATTESLPSGGDTLATVAGSGTLPSTNLAYEPLVDHVEWVKNVTANKSHIVVVFRGFYTV